MFQIVVAVNNILFMEQNVLQYKFKYDIDMYWGRSDSILL